MPRQSVLRRGWKKFKPELLEEQQLRVQRRNQPLAAARGGCPSSGSHRGRWSRALASDVLVRAATSRVVLAVAVIMTALFAWCRRGVPDYQPHKHSARCALHCGQSVQHSRCSSVGRWYTGLHEAAARTLGSSDSIWSCNVRCICSA